MNALKSYIMVDILFFAFLIDIVILGVKSDQIDDAIANAIFNPTSNLCGDAGVDYETTFSSVFTSTGGWRSVNADYEDDAFDIEMSHNDKKNSNHTWSMRIGKGGQIVSFIGPYGEANANQGVEKAAWNDLVTQLVAVNNKRNNKPPYNGYQHFIHGSGPYMKDEGMPPPFYNPKVAFNCEGNQCTLVNWGQQAHVPTVHRSDVLYYQRYRNCGNGVIEYDQAIHHFGTDSTDVLDYFNTPWSNVRTSSLPKMMISDTSGNLGEPIALRGWGSAPVTDQIKNLDETGGFTTFTQRPDAVQTTIPFDLFCIDPNSTTVANVDCSTSGSTAFTMVTQADNTAFESTHHTNVYGYYAVRMTTNDLSAPVKLTCAFCYITVTNSRTNFSFMINHVIHWAWEGKYFYFGPSVSAAIINQEFKQGDELVMTQSHITREDIFAHGASSLSFVHGQNPEFHQAGNSFYNAKSRMRWGNTNSNRDGTVWTTNLQGNLRPQETYFNRKYLVSGNVKDAESRSSSFVSETLEELYSTEDLNTKFNGGEKIHLYSDGSNFGAVINNETCNSLIPGASNDCSGSNIPAVGAKPLFYISCGDDISKFYVGENPYRFAPDINDSQGQALMKPYICANEDLSVRPTYKLLGYFKVGDCNLDGQIYNETFCLNDPVPALESIIDLNEYNISDPTCSGSIKTLFEESLTCSMTKFVGTNVSLQFFHGKVGVWDCEGDAIGDRVENIHNSSIAATISPELNITQAGSVTFSFCLVAKSFLMNEVITEVKTLGTVTYTYSDSGNFTLNVTTEALTKGVVSSDVYAEEVTLAAYQCFDDGSEDTNTPVAYKQGSTLSVCLQSNQPSSLVLLTGVDMVISPYSSGFAPALIVDDNVPVNSALTLLVPLSNQNIIQIKTVLISVFFLDATNKISVQGSARFIYKTRRERILRIVKSTGDVGSSSFGLVVNLEPNQSGISYVSSPCSSNFLNMFIIPLLPVLFLLL